jgi:hypothetical protein
MGVQLASGPPIGLPLDLARFPRLALEALTEALIGHLDALDVDPDLEGEWSEDEISSIPTWVGIALRDGPGCPIADPDMAADDEACDEAFQDLEEVEQLVPVYGIDQSKGPKPLRYGQDRALMHPHVERIRRHSCRRLTRADVMGRSHELIV